MGLLDLYSNFNSGNGSSYNYDDVTETTQPFLLGSTNQSKLHATLDGQAGYSLNGGFFDEVNNMNSSYNNGGAISLPTVIPNSIADLDLEGNQPPTYSNPETGETYV